MKSNTTVINWLVIAIVSILLSWMTYRLFYHTNVEHEQKRFQKEFTSLEKKQQNFKKILTDIVHNNTIEEIWKIQKLRESSFSVLLFKDDSLIYWNNSQITFDQSYAGDNSYFLGEFPNGYYLVDKFMTHDIKVYISSQVKSQYFYQNKALHNTISKHFNTTNELEITFEKSAHNYPITSLDNSTLFYITVLKEKTISKYRQLMIYGFYCLGFLGLLVALTLLLRTIAERQVWLLFAYPLALLGARFLSIKYAWIKLFEEFELFDPDLYATSAYAPNFGDLIFNLIIIFIVIWWVLHFINRINEKTRRGTFGLIISFLATLIYSLFVSHTIESLIINSSIPMVIDEVFSLNVYSFIGLIIIALLFLSYYFLIRQVSLKLVKARIRMTQLAMLWFFSSVAFLLVEFFYFEHGSFHATWPIILNGLFIYLAATGQRVKTLKYHIGIVIVVSFYAAFMLFENNQLNEHQKRELYANQLITDQDPTMEIEYAETMYNLVNNPEFYQLLDGAGYFSAPNFTLQIENCCFDSYWERYEMEFSFFQEDGTPLFEYIGQSRTVKDFNQIIKRHSNASSIAEGLYFVSDYYDQLSYIGHQKITNLEGDKVDLFILFKSKKIPENIGFPRLLMNEQSYALQDLEDYSIARYSKNKLVMRYGGFNYPTTMDGFLKKAGKNEKFITINGINHFIYTQDGGQGVIISKPEKRFIELLSTFSYLVLFFGVFALVVLGLFNLSHLLTVRSLQLSRKVQVVLIGTVVVSFAVFGLIAIQNVNQQYDVNTTDNLKEKISSIETVVSQRMGDKSVLTPSMHGDYMNYLLKRLSTVFGADINFYTTDGQLFATSQAKIYDKGISTVNMNSKALFELEFKQNSEFIHHEKLGNLSFLSGYVPFTNFDGKLLGYINLQHFSKQNAFERQLNEFVVAVINVAVLLLVISVLLAIIVSGWITSPLRLIQQSFAKVELGKVNKPIDYKGDDEIGALVKDYNDKLAELELKAMQLAKSERETAWREMAKQVAHEIKNPLTPMKLSVQHFQRSFDPNDPNAKEKMQRLVSSLIEQIDALTNIANEFSNFAKMPIANEENLDLISLLKNIVDLYSSNKVKIDLSTDGLEEANVYSDKDLILRAFNNLVKNAIQAADEQRKMHIQINVAEEGTYFLIAVKDNGVGIPKAIRAKMFTPNFTTKSTGSGLGLAMVKQIITTHNGEIWFDSEIGKGTIFYIKLPKIEEKQ